MIFLIPYILLVFSFARMRSIDLLRRDGIEVHETTLTLADFDDASEIFLTANAAKITPVTRYKDRHMNIGPMAMRARELYWDYATTARVM